MKYIFGSLLLFDILIFSYDFGTATFLHVILPNGHCSYFGQLEYDTRKIPKAYYTINKIIQITLSVVYFVYHCKLDKILKMLHTSALNIDHQQNQLFFKLAVTMAATIGTSQFVFAYTNVTSPIESLCG